ncbi:MAG TPA: hypothetical protein VGE04_08060, partial [Chloroflexia bacterium]
MQDVNEKDPAADRPSGKTASPLPEAAPPANASAPEAAIAPDSDPGPETISKPEAATATPADPDDLNSRFEEGLRHWILDTAKGIVTSTATVLFVLVLVQLGLASEGQELSFDLFSPYEFWKSFSGLVVQWSQWNEWLLLALAFVTLAVTVGLFAWWRRHQAREAAKHHFPGHDAVPGPTGRRKGKRRNILFRVQSSLRSMKGVSA